LPHIPKFQAWHLLPPVTVAIENCGHVAYRRSPPGLPTIARIDRKALLQKALRRNRQILHEKDDYPEIGDVNRQVSEWYDSEFYGPSYALDLIERRAYDVADRSLELATALRNQFGLPRRQLGQHERDIERNIHERAIAGRPRPSIWRFWRLMRFALAKHRCAPVPLRIRFHAARRRSIARVRRLIGLRNSR